MVTGDMRTSQPGGPTGCGWGFAGLLIVAGMIGLFIAAVWWMLRDLGQL